MIRASIPLTILPLLLGLGGCRGEGGEMLRSEPLKFERLTIPEVERQKQGTGASDKAIPAQVKVFTNAASWREFWAGYTSDKPGDIDFRSNIVVGVFLGPASPGHGVEITRIDYHPKGPSNVIRVTDWKPSPSFTYPAVIVHPADVVRFPFRPSNAHAR